MNKKRFLNRISVQFKKPCVQTIWPDRKVKRVSTDFPNLAILTKSATPGEIQATYVHVSFGNKSLGETVTAFALSGSLEAPTVVLIDIERALAGDGEKIRLPATEVLLYTATSELSKLKKLWYWTARNSVLLLPFLTDIALIVRETTAETLMKISIKRITEQDAENSGEASDSDKESHSNEDNEKSKTRSTKDVTARNATDGIGADCGDILTFI